MHQQQQQWQSVVVMVVVVDMAAGKTDSFEDLKITISSRGRRNKVSQEWPNARDGMFVFTWDLPLALSDGGVRFPITPSNFHRGGPRNAARGARDSTAGFLVREHTVPSFSSPSEHSLARSLSLWARS